MAPRPLPQKARVIPGQTDFEAARNLYMLKPYSWLGKGKRKRTTYEIREQIRMRAPSSVTIGNRKIETGGGGAGFFYPGLRSDNQKVRERAVAKGALAKWNSVANAITEDFAKQEREKQQVIPGYAENFRRELEKWRTQQVAQERAKIETITGYGEKMREELGLKRSAPAKRSGIKPWLFAISPVLSLLETQKPQLQDPYYMANEQRKHNNVKADEAWVNAQPASVVEYVSARDADKKRIAEAYGGNILGPYPESTRQRYIEQAKKNGWTKLDYTRMTDEEVVEKAFTTPASTLVQEVRDWTLNAGRETSEYLAAPAAIAMIGTEAAKGNWSPAKDAVKATVSDFYKLGKAAATGDAGYIYNYAKNYPISTGLTFVEGIGIGGKVATATAKSAAGTRALRAAGLGAISDVARIRELSYRPPGLKTRVTVGPVRQNIFSQALVPLKRRILEYDPKGSDLAATRRVMARVAESYRSGRFGVQRRAASNNVGRSVHNATVIARQVTKPLEGALGLMPDRLRRRVVFALATAPRILVRGEDGVVQEIDITPGRLADRYEEWLEDGNITLLNGDVVPISYEDIQTMRAVVLELRELDKIPQSQVDQVLSRHSRGLRRVLRQEGIEDIASAIEATNRQILIELGFDSDNLTRRLYDLTRWTAENDLEDAVRQRRANLDADIRLLEAEMEALKELLRPIAGDLPRVPYARKRSGLGEEGEGLEPSPGIGGILEERTVFTPTPEAPYPGPPLPDGVSILVKPKLGVNKITKDDLPKAPTKEQFLEQPQKWGASWLYNIKTAAGIIPFRAFAPLRNDVIEYITRGLDLTKKNSPDLEVALERARTISAPLDGEVVRKLSPEEKAAQVGVHLDELFPESRSEIMRVRQGEFEAWVRGGMDWEPERGSARNVSGQFATSGADFTDSSGAKRVFRQHEVKDIVGEPIIIFADDMQSATLFARSVMSEILAGDAKLRKAIESPDRTTAKGTARYKKAQEDLANRIRQAATQQFVTAWMKARRDDADLLRFVDDFDARVKREYDADLEIQRAREAPIPGGVGRGAPAQRPEPTPEPTPGPEPTPTPEPEQAPEPASSPAAGAPAFEDYQWENKPVKISAKEAKRHFRNLGILKTLKVEALDPSNPFRSLSDFVDSDQIASEIYKRAVLREPEDVVEIPTLKSGAPGLPINTVLRVTHKVGFPDSNNKIQDRIDTAYVWLDSDGRAHAIEYQGPREIYAGETRDTGWHISRSGKEGAFGSSSAYNFFDEDGNLLPRDARPDESPSAPEPTPTPEPTPAPEPEPAERPFPVPLIRGINDERRGTQGAAGPTPATSESWTKIFLNNETRPFTHHRTEYDDELEINDMNSEDAYYRVRNHFMQVLREFGIPFRKMGESTGSTIFFRLPPDPNPAGETQHGIAIRFGLTPNGVEGFHILVRNGKGFPDDGDITLADHEAFVTTTGTDAFEDARRLAMALDDVAGPQPYQANRSFVFRFGDEKEPWWSEWKPRGELEQIKPKNTLKREPAPKPTPEPTPTPEPEPTPEPTPEPEPPTRPAPERPEPLQPIDPNKAIAPISEYIPRYLEPDEMERIIDTSRQEKLPPRVLKEGFSTKGVTYWREGWGDNARLIALVRYGSWRTGNDTPERRAETLLHEVIHGIPNELSFVAQKDLATLESWIGRPLRKWRSADHEKFVDSVINYLQSGKAPNPKLQNLYNAVRTYLLHSLNQLFRRERGYVVELPDDVKAVINSYFGYEGDLFDRNNLPAKTNSPIRAELRKVAIKSGGEPAEVDTILSLLDARARMWSQITGRPANEWWAAANGGGIRGAVLVKYDAQLSLANIQAEIRWIQREIKDRAQQRDLAVTEAMDAAATRGTLAGSTPRIFVSTAAGAGTGGAARTMDIASGRAPAADRGMLGSRAKRRSGRAGKTGNISFRAEDLIRRAGIPTKSQALIRNLAKFIKQNSEEFVIRNAQDYAALTRRLATNDLLIIDMDRVMTISDPKLYDELLDRLSGVVPNSQAEVASLFDLTPIEINSVKRRLDAAPDQPITLRLIPRATSDEMQKVLTEAMNNDNPSRFQRWTNVWQNITLTVLPRTFTGNITGNTILAAMKGFRPSAFGIALARYRRGTLPPELQSRGIYGVLTTPVAGRGRNLLLPVRAWMNFWRTANILTEDLARATIYIDEIMTEANRQVGRKWLARFRRMNEDAKVLVDAYLDGTAAGPKAERARMRALQSAEDWLGAYRRGGTFERSLAAAIPFNQWYRHMIKLTFITMPYDYPGRSIMLNTLAQIGMEYHRENGVWPEWALDLLPLWEEDRETWAGKQRVIGGISTANLNPFATADIIGQLATNPISGVLRNANPLVNSLVEAVFVTQMQPRGPETVYDPETGERLRVGMNKPYLMFVARQAEQLLPINFLRDPNIDPNQPLFSTTQRKQKVARGLETTKPTATNWFKFLRAVGIRPQVVDAQGPVRRAQIDSYIDSLERRRNRQER